MTIDKAKEAEIRRLHFAEHWKIGTIATQLGLHHDAVERVLGLGKGARSRPVVRDAEAAVSEVPLPLRGYEAFVIETLTQYPRLRATRLYDMLVERGYEGSVRTVRRHVRLVRPAPKSEAFLRVEPLIAEQAQVDWAYVGKLRVAGGTRQLWAFVMVLSYSRAIWGELVLDLSASSLRRSLVRACCYFGGATRQWLFDNPKTVVLERHGDAVRFHPDLLALAGQLRVAPRLCAVRKPQQKGKVERAIRFLRDRFFAARTIRDLDRGNAELLVFLDEIANVRPHPRWPERPVDQVLAEERTRLLALPEPLPETDLVEPVPVDKTAFVHFDGNRYSAPSIHHGNTLMLVANDATVRLSDGGTEVARHVRCWGRHQIIEAPEHRAELLDQKRAAREAKGRDRLGAAIPGFEILQERWVEAGRNVGFMTAKALRLLDLYGVEILGAAAREAIARGTHDPGALAVLCEERRRAADGPVPVDIDLGAHVPDRDVIPHDLESYDAQR
ncbi:IS21 family transposase [Sorangium sp. So ce388]|uniref:IS21 family transposase n=1 Tax=Sorangium sp. So ce388 TaxID=3133309 RepID=UPI003F5BECCD